MTRTRRDECVFTSRQVMAITGMTLRNIQYWTGEGIITPSADPGVGRGKGKRWSFTDMIGMRVMRTLRKRGVSLQALRKVLPELQAIMRKRDPLSALASSPLAVTSKNTVVAITHDNAFDVATKQGVLDHIPLHDALVQVERRMLKLRRKDKQINSNIEVLKQQKLWAA